MALRTTAVKKIQKNWLIYRMISVGPKIVRARKDKAAIIVQKIIKGYLGNKKAIHMLMVAKVSETAEYFQKIAAHRLLGAVLKA